MSDQFVGEIRIFACNFAPYGWVMCNGQILPISQYAALFSLLGTTYGGNGTSNFALPDLEGSVAVNAGQGPGLSQYDLGEFGGSQSVTLIDSQNPMHNHLVNASTVDGSSANPSGLIYAKGQYVDPNNNKGAIQLYTVTAPTTTLNGAAIGNTGSGQPHNNMMPTIALNYCIALQGAFPQRP